MNARHNVSFLRKTLTTALVVILLSAVLVSTVFADTTGARFPTAQANVNGPGTVAWAVPVGSLGGADTNYATAVLNNATSEYLQATGFGFTIPTNARIDGIQVTIMRRSSSNFMNNSIDDADLYLLKNVSGQPAIVGTDNASTSDWPTTMGTANYGATNYLWGTTWTADEINHANFGVALSAYPENNNNRTASVDYITVTVTYTLPTTTVADATNPSNKTVGGSQTNQAVSAFTLATNFGTDTVTGLVVTGGGTGIANVAPNGVKIYRSTDSEWDAGDTLVGTASFSGTTATFTGLNIAVTTTVTRYIITYDIIASPTPGQTMTGVISGATATNPVTNTDAVDATLAVGYTITSSVTGGTGGTITATMVVADGATPTFYSVPNTGYIVADVLVDGISVQRANTYTFSAVHANHTISVTFDGGPVGSSQRWYQPSAVGSGSGWTNTANGFTSDNSYATSNSLPGSNANYINFNIPTIPPGSVIKGIEVAYEGYTGNTNANVALSGDLGSSFAPTSYLTTFIADVPDRTVVLGGPTNTWGSSTWASNDFTNGEFYLRISSDNLAQLYLDQVQVRVHYTRPTVLTTTAVTGTYGGTVDLTATLLSNGIGVSGQTVTFTLNGNPVGTGVTDVNGVATLTGASLAGINANTYPTGVGAAFAGSSDGVTGYAAASDTDALTVNQRVLTVSATGITKTYDGNANASVAPSDDRVPGDTLTITFDTPQFSDKNVGVGKTVTVTGITVTGADAGNYTWNTTATTTADITARDLTVTITASDKVYDGTADAAVVLADNRVAAGDDLSFTYTSALFSDKNVGNNKTVTVSGIAMGGTDAGNYNLLNTTATDTANITPRNLVVSATGEDKIYDGTTSATVTLAHNGIAGDDLVVNYGSALFNSPNVGNNKPVSVSAITLTGTDAGNYTFNETTSTTANIIGRLLTVTATASNKVYDGNTTASVVLSDDHIAGDNLTVTVVSANFDTPDIGTGKTVTVAFSVSGTSMGNYTWTSPITTTADITTRAVTVKADPQTKIYGAADPALTYQITVGSLAPGDSFTGALTRDPGEDVGTYAINQDTLALSSNYALTYVSDNLTITTRAITVTADPQTKVYGTADPVLTYQITSGTLVPGDSFTGALTRDAGEDVGAYAINQDTLALSSNYALTYVSDNLTITARAITVTADPQTKVYGDPDPALTYQITSGTLVPGDSFTGALTRAAGEDVGPHAILQGTLALSSNYALTYVGDNLTITPRAIEVKADPQTKVYGTADPALTYQITSGNLVPGDSFTGALTRVAGEDVGSYAIQQGTLTAGANYTLTYVGDFLTITTRAITVTADPQTKTYGSPDPVLTYQVTSGSLVPGDSFAGALARDPGEDVGTYNITQGTLALNGNYVLSFNGNSFNIVLRAVIVTADPQTKIYGDPDPALTYQITSGSLAPGDSFTGALTRGIGEDVGQHAIMKGTLALNSNYTLVFIGDYLTITPRPVTVTADPQTKIYGDPDPALTYQITSGTLVFGDTFTGALTRDSGEDIGAYAITQGTLALSSNYTLSYVGDFLTITTRAITVTADPQTKVYGTADPALTYQVTSGSLVPGDTFTGALTRVAGEDIGPYAINQGTLALSGNYVLSYVSDNLTITKRAITVTAVTDTKTYDGTTASAGVPVITSGSLVPGDTANFIQTFDTKDVGTGKTLTPSGTVNDGNGGNNYTVTFVPVNTGQIVSGNVLTVSGITANNKTYDGNTVATLNTGSAALVGVQPGDTVTLNVAGATGTFDNKNVGTGKTVTIAGLTISGPDAGNYGLAQPSTTANITARTLTVSATGINKVYDGTTAATVTLSDNRVAGDVLTISYGSASFADKHVGTGKTVSVGGITVVGLDAGNYTFNTTASTTADITARLITISAVADTKAYNGNTASAGVPTITAGSLAPGDTANFSQTFDTKDIGTGKTLTPSGAVNDGNGGNNYAVTLVNNTNGVITGITLTISGVTANNRVYDGTTVATLNTGTAALVGEISGDAVTLNVGGATGTFTDKNVGPGKDVTVTGFTISGTDAGNYTLIQPTGLTANVTGRPITVSAATNTKVYDSTTASATAPTITSGSIAAGDAANFTQTYDTPNVGTSKILTPTGSVNDGNGGGNYLVTFANNTTGVITARPITITADPKIKAFGAPDPALTYSLTSGSLVGADAFSGTLTRVPGESVGTYAILQGSVTAGSNYALTYVGANLTITIINQTITVITPAPATAAYGVNFNVAATASSSLPVAITTTGVCTGGGSTTATIIMSSGSGSCVIHYNQPGDANFSPALEVTQTVIAQKADQTINVNTPAPTNAAYNNGFTVSATATSGLPVTYSAVGVCMNAGSNFTMTSGTGTCTVQYNQAGNVNYNPAPQITQTVNAQKADQTISVTTSAPANAVYGSNFTVAATASSGLAVAYSAAGSCTNAGPNFTMTVSTGICAVQYNQSGDANYNAAPQVTQNVNAQKANQTITVTTSAPPSATNGTSFTVAATATSGLPVAITTSGSCTGSGSGSATITIISGTGACTVMYDQAGNANYNAAAQVTETVNSTKANQTITVTTPAPATAINGTNFSVAATASSSLPVAITTSGLCNGSGTSSATITMTGGTGSCTVYYNQSGNANFNAAPQVTETVTAQKADQTITIINSAPATASNGANFAVLATASSGSPVSYSAVGVCTNVGAVFTMTSGTGTCTVRYDQVGDANFNAAPQRTENVVANLGPAITSAPSANFNVGIAGSFTITTAGNPVPVITMTGTLPAGITFTDNGNGTAVLTGTPASGSGGTYDLVFTAVNGILPNAVQNFVLTVNRGPTVIANGINTIANTGDGHLDEGEVAAVAITKFEITFSKDVNNPLGHNDPNDVTNQANYILVRDNGDGIQTSSCTSSVIGNDTPVTIGTIAYTGGTPFTASFTVNGGIALPEGAYRLIICGTTSITDTNGVRLAGDGTNEGTDFVRNFSVQYPTQPPDQPQAGTLIPVTGFAPGVITTLPTQPLAEAYSNLGDLWLDIPSLGVQSSIVGIPRKNGSWDVSWLWNQTGYLDGSAYPTSTGNSVLTAHVYLPNGKPGPFVNLSTLKWGNQIIVHNGGKQYVYEVRTVTQVKPDAVSTMLKHQDAAWLTLVTCKGYDQTTGKYQYRILVSAVLISVK